MKNKISEIVSSERFKNLVRVRNRSRFLLSILVFFVHAFFIGGIAFYNQWFAEPISDNSIIPRGIVYAVASIILMIFFEFVYIYLSKKVHQPLQDLAKEEL